jgi:hypothetical protein
MIYNEVPAFHVKNKYSDTINHLNNLSCHILLSNPIVEKTAMPQHSPSDNFAQICSQGPSRANLMANAK